MSFSIFHFGQSLDIATWSPWQFTHFGSFLQSSKLCPSSPHPAQTAFPLHEFLVCPNFWHWKHLWGLGMYGRVSFFRYPILILFGRVCPLMVKTTDCSVWRFFSQQWFLAVEVLFWFHLLPFYPVLRIWWQILRNWESYVVKLLQVNSPRAWLFSGDFYIAVLISEQMHLNSVEHFHLQLPWWEILAIGYHFHFHMSDLRYFFKPYFGVELFTIRKVTQATILTHFQTIS